MASLEYGDRVQLLGVLTIPNGGSSSVAFNAIFKPTDPQRKYIAGEAMAPYDSILIVTSEAALTGAVTVKILADHTQDPEVAANYATLQSPPATDVAIAAQKAIVLTAVPFAALSLASAGVEAADRKFRVYGVQNHS